MIFDFENCDVKIITVTPETAMELIGANYKNQRNVKDTNVSKLAQVMKRGEWNPYVGDLVRMTRDGILVDGQHRMLAVIESGVTCRFLFAGNFDLSDFPHIDTGVSRSAADSLGSTPNATKCAATLKAVAALRDGGLNSSRLFLGTYPHSRIVEEMNRVGADNLQRAVAAGSRLRTSIANSGSDAAFTLFSYLADQVSPEMFSALAGEDAAMTDYVDRGGLMRQLADKIDAEIVKAYSEKLDTCAMRWAKANGWPDFREGEDFGAWLERCTYKKPVDDCNEPVQFGDDIELHYSDGGVDKGLFQEVAINKGPVSILSFVGVSHARDYRYDSECDVLKRPAPEVLGADGKPIVEGETVYPIDGEWLRIPLEVSGIESPASVKVYLSAGKSWTTFHADRLTHTPPDTQAKIDADAKEDPCAYFGRFVCEGCPADKNEESCDEIMILDLLRRQRELDARKGGE